LIQTQGDSVFRSPGGSGKAVRTGKRFGAVPAAPGTFRRSRLMPWAPSGARPGSGARRALDRHLPEPPRGPVTGRRRQTLDAPTRRREGGHGREGDARASKQAEDGRCMTVAEVEHGSGPVIRQVEVGSRSNGIPAVRDYARRVGIAGCAVALDVMHTQQETSRSLLDCAPTECSPPSRRTGRKSLPASRRSVSTARPPT